MDLRFYHLPKGRGHHQYWWDNTDALIGSYQGAVGLEWGSPNQLGRQGIRPSTFPEGAKATFKIRPVKSGAPVAAFQAAKFDDGHIVGKWEGDAADQ